MLLNKLPCLDKGFVALIDSANNSARLKEISMDLMMSSSKDDLTVLSSMTIVAKCPLFVQLFFSKFGLTVLSANFHKEPDAYIPNETEVKASSLEDSKMISDDIMRTTEALLINPKAYQSDGCNPFTSQVIMPVSTYTTIVVHGTYAQWLQLLQYKDTPNQILAYQENIKQIFTAEWKNVQV